MRADTIRGQEVSLPLLLVLPSEHGDFANSARVLFAGPAQPEVHAGNYVFSGQVLNYSEVSSAESRTEEVLHASAPLPFLSIMALVLLILFRNIFFSSFSKYFISFRNNYEIDFNLQKIGVPPIVLSILIIFLTMLDFIRMDETGFGLSMAFRAARILFFPMLISASVLFLFSLSLRFFPLIFPDIKVLFFLAILLLVHNLSVYGLQGKELVSMPYFLTLLIVVFFALRSFFLFVVLRKFFRYRSALSLFYICTLNLATSLVLSEILK